MDEGSDLDHRRVKLYSLNGDGQWDDVGTGLVGLVERDGGAVLLVVVSESEDGALMETPITRDDVYKRQDESLIVWNDPHLQHDLALSFQTPQGCECLWTEIKELQQKSGTAQQQPSSDEEEGDVLRLLPEPGPGTLGELRDVLARAAAVPDRSRLVIARELVETDYLERLFDVFAQSEDLEDLPTLHIFFDVFKGIVMLNVPRLLKYLLVGNHLLPIIAGLEYDPQLPRQRHREFLQQKVQFHDVVHLPEPILSKVHNSFRLAYLKDTVLPRFLDDGTFATLGALVGLSHNDIVTHVYPEDAIMSELFAKLEANPPHPDKANAGRFLHELISMAKTLPLAAKADFFMALGRRGLFSVLCDLLQSPETKQYQIAADMLWQTAHQEADIIRGFLTTEQQAEAKFPLLRCLCQQLCTRTDEALQGQLVDVLRLITDGDASKRPELNEFLNAFYDCAMEVVVEPLLRPAAFPVTTQYHVLDFLSYCVAAHSFRSKRFVLQGSLVAKVVALLKPTGCPVFLALSAVRFVRALVTASDDFYNRHIAKNGIFEPLITLFLHNGLARYNLVNSAIISLFEYIRKENVKLLISSVIEQFWPVLQGVKYVDTFQNLKLKYDQNAERDVALAERREDETAVRNGRRTTGVYRDLRDDDDEDYFNASDDDDDDESTPTVSATPPSGAPAAPAGPAARDAPGPAPPEDDDDSPKRKREADADAEAEAAPPKKPNLAATASDATGPAAPQ